MASASELPARLKSCLAVVESADRWLEIVYEDLLAFLDFFGDIGNVVLR